MADDHLLKLAADDAVWMFLMLDWQQRTPRWFQWLRARRWGHEGDSLFDQRDELVRRALALGLRRSGR